MKRSQADSLLREKGLISTGTGALVTTVLSGIATWPVPGLMGWQQWSYLAHTLAGAILAFILLPYSLHHVYRTLGARRPMVLLSGLVTTLILAFLAVTGLIFAFRGQTETTRWMYDYHVIAGFVFVTLLGTHLLLHRVTRRKRGPEVAGINYLSLERRSIQGGLRWSGMAIVLVALLSLAYEFREPAYSGQPSVAPYEHPYGPHPFRPSQTETTGGGFVGARQVGNSASCSTCHEQIFREWQASMHGQAASDRAYMTNVSLLADNKGIAATRYCEGCHAPVALLSGELTAGGEHGGIANTLANREGVSCMGCHGIVEAVHLKGVASYRFRPAAEYLFGDSDHVLARMINNLLIRIHPAQHRDIMAPAILASPTLCATCHAQFMDRDMNDWGWVKMQDEYSAWLNSQYSGSTEQTFSRQGVTRCHDCHLPRTPGEDPSADADGRVVAHRTPGANTAIPQFTADREQLLLVSDFLQSDKMRISIERPWRSDATRNDQHLPEQLRAQQETPHYYYLGETATLRVTVTNQGVGHEFPGGTLDINEAWIEFIVTDAEGHEIYHSGAIDRANNVDEQAVFYRALAIDRHGKHVWKHDLFNMVGDSYRNVVRAGESDIVEFTFTVPSWTKGPLTVSALLRYRKFNNRYARWALKDGDIELPVVDVARHSLTIPVIERPAAYESQS